jgi:hypothetical protein
MLLQRIKLHFNNKLEILTNKTPARTFNLSQTKDNHHKFKTRKKIMRMFKNK